MSGMGKIMLSLFALVVLIAIVSNSCSGTTTSTSSTSSTTSTTSKAKCEICNKTAVYTVGDHQYCSDCYYNFLDWVNEQTK